MTDIVTLFIPNFWSFIEKGETKLPGRHVLMEKKTAKHQNLTFSVTSPCFIHIIPSFQNGLSYVGDPV